MINFPAIKLPALSKRPAHTLLFITEVKTFRVDVDKAGVLFGNAEMTAAVCPSPAKLADCVNTIAANSRPFGHKVWLLYVRLPITLLSIPSMQVEGVDEATLMQALQEKGDVSIFTRVYFEYPSCRSHYVNRSGYNHSAAE